MKYYLLSSHLVFHCYKNKLKEVNTQISSFSTETEAVRTTVLPWQQIQSKEKYSLCSKLKFNLILQLSTIKRAS